MSGFVALAALAGAPALAQERESSSEQMTLASGNSQYTCEEAQAIIENTDGYKDLKPSDFMEANLRVSQCRSDGFYAARGEPPQERVVAIPRTVDGESRIFYGTIPVEDLRNAQRNCSGAGAVA